MDSRTAFIVVATTVVANAGILMLISRDLPAILRPAINFWQVGTLLVAIGCALFAFAAPVPVVLILVNSLFLLGLFGYHRALARFYGDTPSAIHFVPVVFGVAVVFWFSVMADDFKVRVAAITIAWVWLMLECARTLRSRNGDKAMSRTVLRVMFLVMAGFTVARAAVYFTSPLPPDFNPTTGNSFVNFITPAFMAVLPVIGTTTFILMCSDRLRKQLEVVASYDHLTGLANRRTLMHTGVKMFGRAREEGIGFAVAVLDLDHFKVINDTYGHGVGDQALIYAANRLKQSARRVDLVARSGGEEFVVLLDDLDEDGALASAERIRVSVETEPFQDGAAIIPITVSAGVAVHHAGDESFDTLLRRADRALYEAKESGRNRIVSSSFAVSGAVKPVLQDLDNSDVARKPAGKAVSDVPVLRPVGLDAGSTRHGGRR